MPHLPRPHPFFTSTPGEAVRPERTETGKDGMGYVPLKIDAGVKMKKGIGNVVEIPSHLRPRMILVTCCRICGTITGFWRKAMET